MLNLRDNFCKLSSSWGDILFAHNGAKVRFELDFDEFIDSTGENRVAPYKVEPFTFVLQQPSYSWFYLLIGTGAGAEDIFGTV